MTLKDDWLGQLAALPCNWDSYGAPQITEQALAALGSFSVVPLHDGGLQLECHRDGADIEVVIDANGKVSFVYD